MISLRDFISLGIRLLAVIALLFPAWSIAQTPTLYIDSIHFSGNKKTVRFVMLQEMSIHEGDSIRLDDLMPKLKENENRLLNSGLFDFVTCNIQRWEGDRVSISVKVKEAWYLFPLPVVELADRNFNVWWQEQDRRLNRLNAGVWVWWMNFSGRNDLVKIAAQVGYTTKFELEYRRPFIHRNSKIGFTANLLYSANKELAWNTIDNKLAFFRDIDRKEPMFRRYRGGGAITWRPRNDMIGELAVNYLHVEIADTIQALNADYFAGGQRQQRALNSAARFIWDGRDIRPYPTQGFYFKTSLEKNGMGLASDINLLFLYAEYQRYIKLSPRWHISLAAKGKKSLLGGKPPYYNLQALGYNNDFVRGYQLYVIDGQDYALFQSDVHFKLAALNMRADKFPIKRLRLIPMRFYLRAHADAGYVHDAYYDTGNSLDNQLLLGGGLSFDWVLMNDIILQIDYTVNLLGEKGLFLRQKYKF